MDKDFKSEMSEAKHDDTIIPSCHIIPLYNFMHDLGCVGIIDLSLGLCFSLVV